MAPLPPLPTPMALSLQRIQFFLIIAIYAAWNITKVYIFSEQGKFLFKNSIIVLDS